MSEPPTRMRLLGGFEQKAGVPIPWLMQLRLWRRPPLHSHLLSTMSRPEVDLQRRKQEEERVARVCDIVKQGWGEEAMKRVRCDKLSAREVACMVRMQADPQVAYTLFRWAESQKGYRHSKRSYYALMCTLGSSMDFEGMWHLVEEMQSRGVGLDMNHFSTLLTACTKHHEQRHLEAAVTAFREVRNKVCASARHFIFSCIIHMLYRGGDEESVKRTYHEEGSGSQPNLLAACDLIHVFCKARELEQAVKVLSRVKEEGMTPDKVVHSMVLQEMMKVGRVEEARKLFREMKEKGPPPDFITHTIVAAGLARAGEVEEAREVFGHMKTRNLHAYNSYMDGMLTRGDVDMAYNLFQEMQDQGTGGDAITYTLLINAFLKVGRTQEAGRLYQELNEKGFLPDAICCTAFICGLVKAGHVKKAVQVFNHMKQLGLLPSLQNYNLLIHSLLKTCQLQAALDLFQEMKVAGIVPSVVTYNILIKGLGGMGRFHQARALFQELIATGETPTIITYNTLIHSFFKAGKPHEALHLFSHMKSSNHFPPSRITYNTLINGLVKAGQPDEAITLFREMRAQGLVPNCITYSSLKGHPPPPPPR